MYFRLKEPVNLYGLLGFLTVLTVLFGAGSIIFGMIWFPFAVAFYAMIVLAENNRSKLFTCIIPAVCILIGIILLVKNINSFSLFAIPVAGFVIAALFLKGFSKGEISVYLCCLVSVLLIFSLWYALAGYSGSYNISEILEYVGIEFSAFKTSVVEQLHKSLSGDATSQNVVLYTTYIEKAMDILYNLIPAMIVIVAFFFTGVSLKLFSILAFRYGNKDKDIVYWRFSTTNLLAYFYCFLFIVSAFNNELNSVLSIAFANLFYIFLAVYAYIGFNFVVALLSQRRGKGFALFTVVMCIFLLNILAIEILSIFGVLFTKINNKINMEKKPD